MIKWHRKKVHETPDEAGAASIKSRCGQYVIRQWLDSRGYAYTLEVDGKRVNRGRFNTYWKTIKEAKEYAESLAAREQVDG